MRHIIRLMEKNIDLSAVPDSLINSISDSTPVEIIVRYAGLAEEAARGDYGLFDNNVVVIDTETTGLSFAQDELIQIAAAKVNRGIVVGWFNTFVNPGKFITPDISNLTRISDADVIDAPTPAEALTQLTEFVGDAVLVAHNATFDRTFLTTRHPEGAPMKNNLWIDSLDLGRIALPRLRSHRLRDLVEAFGTTASSHRADDDVAATCEVFRILLAAVDSLPTEILCSISRLATVESWPSVAVFKYFALRHLQENVTEIKDLSNPLPTRAPHASLKALRTLRLGLNKATGLKNMESLKRDPWEEDAKGNQSYIAFPGTEDIKEAFDPRGLVGSLYENYESRPEQITMSQAVSRAFRTSQNLIVEAGTGVGKSMAYLAPSALLAKAGRLRVGIATKTNQLLDQLMFHELPALAKAFEPRGGLKYVALKGYTHYPCLRRIEILLRQSEERENGMSPMLWYNEEVSPAPTLAGVLTFLEQTAYDDLDNLRTGIFGLLRRDCTCTGNECMKRKCPFYLNGCFVHGVRREAENADIVVTNHALLFCDLVSDGALLPPIRYWVVDEAHGAETAVRDAFTIKLEAGQLLRLAGSVSSGDVSSNVYLRAKRIVEPLMARGEGVIPGTISDLEEKGKFGPETQARFRELLEEAETTGKEFAHTAEEFARRMKDLNYFESKERNRSAEYDGDLTKTLWLNRDMRSTEIFGNVSGAGRLCSVKAQAALTVAQKMVAFLEDMDGAATVQNDVAATAFGLRDVMSAVEILCGPTDPAYVYSAAVCKKTDKALEEMSAHVMDVGENLNETLYARTDSVVYASATMAMGDNFAPFARTLGLESGENSATTLQLTSSFDFDANMIIYVPTDMPSPTETRYLECLQELLTDVHVALGGSILTLFTNRRDMMKCYEAVCPRLIDHDLRLICQRTGVSAKSLRDDFVANNRLSLFALKTFWQGFDAPGDTLRGVVVAKLPFGSPNEPLALEREAREGNAAWSSYSLPPAVLDVKQAVGRLIRRSTDRGVVILADSRIISKSYGKQFLDSMPSKTIKKLTIKEIAEDIQRNFS